MSIYPDFVEMMEKQLSFGSMAQSNLDRARVEDSASKIPSAKELWERADKIAKSPYDIRRSQELVIDFFFEWVDERTKGWFESESKRARAIRRALRRHKDGILQYLQLSLCHLYETYYDRRVDQMFHPFGWDLWYHSLVESDHFAYVGDMEGDKVVENLLSPLSRVHSFSDRLYNPFSDGNLPSASWLVYQEMSYQERRKEEAAVRDSILESIGWKDGAFDDAKIIGKIENSIRAHIPSERGSSICCEPLPDRLEILDGIFSCMQCRVSLSV